MVADLLGTPTELLASDGTIVWRASLTLWGEQRERAPEPDACPLRFPGQYHDTETGWHYNYFRHYDPQTAQYTGPDPLGLEPAPNPYAYVGNPLIGSDPLGLAESASLGGSTNPYPDRESAYPAARQLAGVPEGKAPDLTWQVGGDVTKRGSNGYFWSPDQTHWGNFE
ncbi:RHS repeat-associated core domain-containing protein [Actinospica robiniae]|uniref:RHS repeat-associated core domain-containing protein n=1 Tax=Actinospica robiniae TaxID=304901 RepID=UPI003CCB8C86